MPALYRFAADGVVILHMGYVSFVVVGQLLILVGIVRHWKWIRNVWFRGIHLGAIALVVVESLLHVTCPLTTLEQRLRQQAGDATYAGDFVGTWVHELLFIDCTPEAFTWIYSLFGLIVLATFVCAPPRR